MLIEDLVVDDVLCEMSESQHIRNIFEFFNDTCCCRFDEEYWTCGDWYRWKPEYPFYRSEDFK